jgi:hypothetical protein
VFSHIKFLLERVPSQPFLRIKAAYPAPNYRKRPQLFTSSTMSSSPIEIRRYINNLDIGSVEPGSVAGSALVAEAKSYVDFSIVQTFVSRFISSCLEESTFDQRYLIGERCAQTTTG